MPQMLLTLRRKENVSLTAYCLSLLEKEMEELKGVQGAGALLPMASSTLPFTSSVSSSLQDRHTSLRMLPGSFGWPNSRWCNFTRVALPPPSPCTGRPAAQACSVQVAVVQGGLKDVLK